MRSPPAVYSMTKQTCWGVWKQAKRFTRKGCRAWVTISKIRFSHIRLGRGGKLSGRETAICNSILSHVNYHFHNCSGAQLHIIKKEQTLTHLHIWAVLYYDYIFVWAFTLSISNSQLTHLSTSSLATISPFFKALIANSSFVRCNSDNNTYIKDEQKQSRYLRYWSVTRNSGQEMQSRLTEKKKYLSALHQVCSQLDCFLVFWFWSGI